MFDPPLPRGPNEYCFHFIGIGNGSRGFKNTINVNRPFCKLENVLFDGAGWVGGWVGWTEYQMGPLIFFILCGYIDKVYT